MTRQLTPRCIVSSAALWLMLAAVPGLLWPLSARAQDDSIRMLTRPWGHIPDYEHPAPVGDSEPRPVVCAGMDCGLPVHPHLPCPENKGEPGPPVCNGL